MSEVFRPRTTAEALAYRGETGALLFSGGTDLMVRHRGYSGTLPTIDEPVLFLDAIEELHRIEIEDTTVVIGAAATLSEILADSRVPELLHRAIGLIAAPALRNRATLAGNICNASPAADSLPPLYVHDGEVVLSRPTGERAIAISEFISGPGVTTLGTDEVMTAIRVPLVPVGRIYYRKVGTRRANALAKLSVAGYARIDEDRALSDVRIAVGAVAPTVVRLNAVERVLTATSTVTNHPNRLSDIRELARPYIRPIDDQRSTAQYRTSVALNAVEEFVHSLMEDR